MSPTETSEGPVSSSEELLVSGPIKKIVNFISNLYSVTLYLHMFLQFMYGYSQTYTLR